MVLFYNIGPWCYNAECRYAQRHYDKCYYVDCHHGESRGAIIITMQLSKIQTDYNKDKINNGIMKLQLSQTISDKRLWRHDTQYNDTGHNDTQHNDIQHNDTGHNDSGHNDTGHNDTQHNDTQHNDTQ